MSGTMAMGLFKIQFTDLLSFSLIPKKLLMKKLLEKLQYFDKKCIINNTNLSIKKGF